MLFTQTWEALRVLNPVPLIDYAWMVSKTRLLLQVRQTGVVRPGRVLNLEEPAAGPSKCSHPVLQGPREHGWGNGVTGYPAEASYGAPSAVLILTILVTNHHQL